MQPEPIVLPSDPQPWKGSAYSRQPIRLLVVGESHKMSDGEPAPTGGIDLREFTVRAVSGRIAGHDNAPFWRNIELALFDETARFDSGDSFSKMIALSDFWHSVAFANFFTRVMDSQADRPRPDEYKVATKRLASLVNALTPDLVCVFSMEAFKSRPWGEPPEYDELQNLPIDDPAVERLTRYTRPDKGITVLAGFKHPSRSGFQAARLRFNTIRETALSD